MGLDKKNKRMPAILKKVISHDMLPINELDFYDSEWNEWLNRINAGFKAEENRLKELVDGATEEYAEVLAEDYWLAKNISGNMYAALIVSVWAKIERFLRSLCRYCTCFGVQAIDNNPNIVAFSNYFDQTLGINLQTIKHCQSANALRVLSNAFKHNDCHYKPDSFPIDKSLAEEYGIAKCQSHTSCRIEYINLPVKEMILAAGSFCKELLEKTEAELKTKTQNEQQA